MTDSAENVSLIAKLLTGDPIWCWDWKYNPSLYQHMHALGVIAANYNDLEGEFYKLFWLTFHEHRIDLAKLVFSKLNNAERIEAALRFIEKEPHADFRERFECFINGYAISTENRNNLMHSRAHNASAKDGMITALTLAKSLKADLDEQHFVTLELSELRGVADDMANLASFGWNLLLWRVAQYTGGSIPRVGGDPLVPTLPDKFPKLRKLILAPQKAPTAAPDQRQP
ncbi:hypothetical protein BH10PSE10_BH10PSE10_08210 [soil metagenome]